MTWSFARRQTGATFDFVSRETPGSSCRWRRIGDHRLKDLSAQTSGSTDHPVHNSTPPGAGSRLEVYVDRPPTHPARSGHPESSPPPYRQWGCFGGVGLSLYLLISSDSWRRRTVAHHAVVGELEDQRLRVLVHDHDRLRSLHPSAGAGWHRRCHWRCTAAGRRSCPSDRPGTGGVPAGVGRGAGERRPPRRSLPALDHLRSPRPLRLHGRTRRPRLR